MVKEYIGFRMASEGALLSSPHLLGNLAGGDAREERSEHEEEESDE